MSIAPIAGGFINNLVGFRVITCNSISSVISWIMLYFQLPETKKEKTFRNKSYKAKNFIL